MIFLSLLFTRTFQKGKSITMSVSINRCQVCGAAIKIYNDRNFYHCRFCGFEKNIDGQISHSNEDLLCADDINQYFCDKFNSMKPGQTFELSIPVKRFYKSPKAEPDQVNFFTSKNIMFLLEQHGFLMVSRKSRFSTELSLVVRKV